MSTKANEFTDYRYYRIVSDEMRFKSLAFKIRVNHSEGLIRFSVAQCSAKDNFSKMVARNMLDNRFDGVMYSPANTTHISRWWRTA